MATLYKEGVEGKYKWLTPKQAKKNTAFRRNTN
jgi:hypothetical protein